MDIDPSKFFGGITFGSVILWILELASLIAVADFVGFLPKRIANIFARNRLEATLHSLKRLGVRVSWQEEVLTLTLVERLLDAAHISEPAYKTQLRELLEEATFHGDMNVGGTRSFSSSRFVDVMGSSTSFVKALEYAKILNTHAVAESIHSFDVVATPKTGCPILGHEFAKLVSRPLVLGVLEKVKDKTNQMGSHSCLDFPRALELRDKKVLLVDDSSTGGRKMVALAHALRKEGATVTDALVLFEPTGKGARELLDSEHIKLHSIVEGPNGRF